jgi:hypothetical protein
MRLQSAWKCPYLLWPRPRPGPATHIDWRNQGNALIDLRIYAEAIVSTTTIPYYSQTVKLQPRPDIRPNSNSGLTVQAPETKPARLLPECSWSTESWYSWSVKRSSQSNVSRPSHLLHHGGIALLETRQILVVFSWWRIFIRSVEI